MAFERMPRPPDVGEYIDIIHQRDKDRGMALVALPALAIVARERLHWRRLGRTASPDTPLGRVAPHLISHLDELVTGQQSARRAAAQLPAVVNEAADSMSTWYSQTAVVLPYAAFLRSEAGGLMRDPSGHGDNVQRFFPDYSDHELDKTAVHIADEIIHQVEGLQPQKVGQEVWYEGESIYLRVRKPAEPTIRFVDKFRARRRRLDRTAYASVSPRMKTEAWLE